MKEGSLYGQDYSELVKYDSDSGNYKYYVQDPDFDEFSQLDYLSSYLIHITNPEGATLTLSGEIPETQEGIPLKQGWNLIGTPFLEEKAVEEAFTGLNFGLDYDQVSRYNNTDKLFENYNNAPDDTLGTLNPGDGTALWSLFDTTWTTPVTAQAIDVEFVYDGDGGRVKKVSPSSTTTYLGSLYEVTTSPGHQVTSKHIFAGANRVCTVDCGPSTVDYRFFHTNHLGSSNVITDENGAQVSLTEYTPFGLTSVQQGDDLTSYKFTGKELDSATGLYYYGARYYDPEIGRFTQADTIVPEPYNPQSLNRYSYCDNNPVNYIDPTGHKKWYQYLGFDKNPFKQLWNEIKGPLIAAAMVVVTAVLWSIPGGQPFAVLAMHQTYVTAAAAATATAVLDTGEGRQLITRVGHEFFDDVLGLDPQIARYLSSLTLHIVATAAFNTLYTNLPSAKLHAPEVIDGEPNAALSVDKGKAASGDPIIDDPAVRAEMEKAWADSFSPDGTTVTEQGGWVKQHPADYLEVERWPSGKSGSIRIPSRPDSAIASFHTHPYAPHEIARHGASGMDYFAARTSLHGLSNYIVDQEGIMIYYPSNNPYAGTFKDILRW